MKEAIKSQTCKCGSIASVFSSLDLDTGGKKDSDMKLIVDFITLFWLSLVLKV